MPGGFVDDSVVAQGFSPVPRISSGWNPGLRICVFLPRGK
jgi:hypothetical protein